LAKLANSIVQGDTKMLRLLKSQQKRRSLGDGVAMVAVCICLFTKG
jgi:hypothetical protein